MADEVAVHLLPESRDLVWTPAAPEPARLAPFPRRPVAPLSTKTPVLESFGFWASFRNPGSGHPRFGARYWKVAASLVPVLLAAAFSPLMPSVSKRASPLAVFSKASNYLRSSVEGRASVILTDDFRSGLGAWESQPDASPEWSYDSNGFARPGTLAVYKPTKGLADYKLEFIAQLGLPLGAAFRIEDWNHYYVLTLVVVQSGAVQALTAVHYAVVDGKEVGRVVRQLPPPIPNTSLYRIGIDVQGSDFTLISQGHVVDYWSDGRYVKGGVGFFSGKGGKARVRWVKVSHQYDLVGRLCALLTPNDGQIREIRN